MFTAKRVLVAAAVVGFAVFYRYRWIKVYGKPTKGCCCVCEALGDLEDAMDPFERELEGLS